MGERCPRRHRGIGVSLGKFAAGRASRLCKSLEKRAGASRSLCNKRIRTVEHGRKRARMVRRLVRRELLQPLSQSKSARTSRRHAQGFAGRFLEASHQGESKRGALEHSAAVPIRRLRLPNRPFFGGLKAAMFERLGSMGRQPARMAEISVCCLHTAVRWYYSEWVRPNEKMICLSLCLF